MCRRVLSTGSPDMLAPPIPQWVPYAARAGAPARRHPLKGHVSGLKEEEKRNAAG